MREINGLDFGSAAVMREVFSAFRSPHPMLSARNANRLTLVVILGADCRTRPRFLKIRWKRRYSPHVA